MSRRSEREDDALALEQRDGELINLKRELAAYQQAEMPEYPDVIEVYWGGGVRQCVGQLEYDALAKRCARQAVELEAAQAKIDALMLEYCPDDMTPQQIENWDKHQRPVDAAIAKGE